jgi:carboxyl-terminal processing protease
MKRQLGLATAGLLCIAALTGCSGTAGDAENKNAAAGSTGTTTIDASSLSAQQCAADNPYLADASATTTTGTLTTEKTWMRAYINEAYLWYDQVPTVDAAAADYSGSMTSLDSAGVPLPLSNYFEALKTKSKTSSNALTDKFSFTYPTAAWNRFSQSGVTFSYGIEWTAINRYAPRDWRIAIVRPGSPAASLGLQRGDTLVTVDGVDFANTTDLDTLNNGLFPTSSTTHTLTFTRDGLTDPFSVQIAPSSRVVIDPVPLTTVIANGSHTVGYLHFTDHIASSEAKLIEAVNTFKAQGVTDLVLDLRYNGGGLLRVASEMAYMIAGPTRVSGKYFEKLKYNANRTKENAYDPMPFYDTSCIFDSNYDCTNVQTLPTLNLARVYILTLDSTCSASESIINSLSGIDVEVILIGDTTCGKPYGFSAKDNCGVSYFPIEFQGINFKGFGDYADGFSPVSSNAGGANLVGCRTGDDPDAALGSTSERMLATALQYITDGTCLPPIRATMTPTVRAMGRASAPGARQLNLVPPFRQNRILLPAISRR